MNKKFLKSTLIAFAGTVLLVSNSIAAFYYDPADYEEYETVFPTVPVSSAANLPAAGSGDNIYIWATNDSLTTWYVAWTGNGGRNPEDIVNYGGEVTLLNSEGEYETFAWENGGAYGDELAVAYNGTLVDSDVNVGEVVLGDFGEFEGNAGPAYDAFSITFTDWETPSYIAFDLSIDFLSPAEVAARTFIGGNFTESLASLQQVHDDDFKIGAPVPEPTTMLLFGTGLAGLAAVARRRRK